MIGIVVIVVIRALASMIGISEYGIGGSGGKGFWGKTRKTPCLLSNTHDLNVLCKT